jgi:hypothetical protein
MTESGYRCWRDGLAGKQGHGKTNMNEMIKERKRKKMWKMRKKRKKRTAVEIQLGENLTSLNKKCC